MNRINEQYIYFLNNKDSLVKEYPGKFLVISDKFEVFAFESKEEAYIFGVNHPEEKEYNGVEGDMPRSQSVGYIFKDNIESSKFGRLVAHEIGQKCQEYLRIESLDLRSELSPYFDKDAEGCLTYPNQSNCSENNVDSDINMPKTPDKLNTAYNF